MPDRWRFWYCLKPVVGVIDGFRWCMLDGEASRNSAVFFGDGAPLGVRDGDRVNDAWRCSR